ncbi:MAG: MotA/TolQ/ExbB proton channel family protein [Myxococcota bacterium]
MRGAWVFGCLLVLASPARALAQDLVRTAKDRRVIAEGHREAVRQRALDERAAAASAFDAALSKKLEAEAAADAAELDLAAARARTQRDGETPQVREARLERWTGTLWTQTATGGAPASAFDRFSDLVKRGLGARLAKLEAESSIRREKATVMARSGEPRTVPVLRIGRALALAGGEDEDTVGFLLEAEGLDRVSGVKFPVDAAAQARAVAAGNGSLAPLDLDGALARSDAPVVRTFADRIEAGGLFVWPIFLVGLLGLVLVGERVRFFVVDRLPEGWVRTALAQAKDGDLEAAIGASAQDGTTRGRVLVAGLRAWGRPQGDRDAALEAALLAEEPRVQRSLNVIAACAAIAPLLGLLGTVTGMITTFDVITVHGTGNPRLLSGGISIALVTTQLGLLVAVPLLLAHAVLSRLAQRRGGELEEIRAAIVERSPSSVARPTPVAEGQEAAS